MTSKETKTGARGDIKKKVTIINKSYPYLPAD